MTIADWHAHDYHASVFQVADDRFELRWTDGINLWEENYPQVELALVRLAALIRSQPDMWFRHQWDAIDGAPQFVHETSLFFDRVLDS
jgi:hypothetical protein